VAFGFWFVALTTYNTKMQDGNGNGNNKQPRPQPRS
jgi:hypothetical protein